MTRQAFFNDSLRILQSLTSKTHNPQIAPHANALWEKHLQKDNPLWNFVTAKPFYIDTKAGSAHVIALFDKRLPALGMVGYFACTNSTVGAEALDKSCIWLMQQHSVKKIFGPINGTATSDYRLNLSESYLFPGEPVNPLSHVDAFKQAGFSDFNHYVSGRTKYYQTFAKLFIQLPKQYDGIYVRPFQTNNQMQDLRNYHTLMTTIFPKQSIYCPTLSWDERLYNFQGKNPFFDPRYTYFLEDKNKPIGLIVSYPYNHNLIIKTVGILPEYRGRRLSSLLIRKVHDIAAEDSLESAIYAMVRQGNAVYKMKKPGVKIIGQYVTMKREF